ncbi:MFS transporter [Planobispora takensis]|uniref:MFS transporter n=1 Tax=Planobispora takensis TaxID=1367882 RepID=A0A8J3SZL2_9ACTN|nr:MFS transporter [Planobispora takensis]GII01230.1 MFS transporter [Planobispora takensis]
MTAPKTIDAPYQPPRIFGPEYRTASLGILLVVTLIAFEGMSIGAIMPAASTELNALNLYGMSFSAFLIAGLFANVAAGLWSDRRGHPVPFLVGVGLFVVGMFLAGAAPSKEVFIVARAVQGLGGGFAVVAIYVMIARVYAPAARPKIFAGLSAAWVLPALVGPGIGGIVAETVGWRWVFYGIIPLVIPALVMLLPALRGGEGQDREEAPARATGPRSRPLPMILAALGTAVGAGVLLYGADQLHSEPVRGGVLSAVGVLALAVGLPRLLPRGALRFGRGLPTTVMMRGVLSAAFFGVNSFIPLVLQKEFGFTLTEAGIALTVGAIGWSSGSYLQARREWDRPKLVRFGAAAVTGGILLTALTMIPGLTGWIMAPAWILAGLGMGVGMSSVSLTTMRQSPDAEQGANSAALQVVDTLGSSLTIGFGGVLINLIGHDDIGAGFLSIVVMTAAIGTLGVVVAGRMREAA